MGVRHAVICLVLHHGRQSRLWGADGPLCFRADEYAARAAEERATSQPTAEGEAPLPLFVMSSMLPGEPLRFS